MKNEAHPLGWQIVDSAYVIQTPHLRLRKDTIVLPGGMRVNDYYVRESRGFTVVFARTKEDRVVLIREYKHGIGRFVRSLPAGGMNPDETPVECAQRELAEETGFVGRNMELVASLPAEPTNSDAILHLCAVDGVERVRDPVLDPTEAIEFELVPMDQLRALARRAEMPIMQIGCIYYMLDRLGAL